MNTQSRSIYLLTLWLLLVSFGSAAATPTDASAILAESTLFGQGESMVYTMEMTIHSRTTDKQRTLELYSYEAEDVSKLLVQVIQPVFLKNLKFLTIIEQDSKVQWLKTSRGVKRIAGSGASRQSLFDSDFTAADLTDLDEDSYELVLAGQDAASTWIEATSLSEEPSRSITIDRTTNLIMEVLYHTGGEAIKRYTVLESRQTPTGVIPHRVEMVDLTKGTSTELTILSSESRQIPSRVFNSSQL